MVRQCIFGLWNEFHRPEKQNETYLEDRFETNALYTNKRTKIQSITFILYILEKLSSLFY
jgi:hypothetical protein